MTEVTIHIDRRCRITLPYGQKSRDKTTINKKLPLPKTTLPIFTLCERHSRTTKRPLQTSAGPCHFAKKVVQPCRFI